MSSKEEVEREQKALRASTERAEAECETLEARIVELEKLLREEEKLNRQLKRIVAAVDKRRQILKQKRARIGFPEGSPQCATK